MSVNFALFSLFKKGCGCQNGSNLVRCKICGYYFLPSMIVDGVCNNCRKKIQ